MKRIFIFVLYAMDGDGTCPRGDTFTHGIWPLDKRAGAAEWQILSVPIIDSPPAISGREGGTTMLKIIAASTIITCHLIQAI